MPRRETARSRDAGFTLVELLVVLVVVAVVMTAIFSLFNSMNKLSRVEIHQADLQQSVRVAQRYIIRLARMAGRGGLQGRNDSGPAYTTPALSVRNNVGEGGSSREVAIGAADTPEAMMGTDILTIRGAFESTPWVVNYRQGTQSFDPLNRTVVLENRLNDGTIPQNLKMLVDAVNAGKPEALVFMSAADASDYGVAELDPANSDVSNYTDGYDDYFTITIAYNTAGGTYANDYVALSPGGVFPNLDNVIMVALLEEYRFYVREIQDDNGVLLNPRLSYARMVPGTEVPYDSDTANLAIDLADNIFDMQVALGFDSSFDGSGGSNGFFDYDSNNTGDDDRIVDEDNTTDDWLFNADGDIDTTTALPWSPSAGIPPWPASQPQPELYYLRLSTLGMAARPDRGFDGGVIDNIEDHVLSATDPVNDADTAGTGLKGRLRRRLLLETTIDLRNLG